MTDLPLIPLTIALFYLLAFYGVFRILLTYRTAQGAIAWIVGLLAMPYLVVPLFLLFGRNRFSGYVRARRIGDKALSSLLDRYEQEADTVDLSSDPDFSQELQVLSKLGRQPFTSGNHCTLLRDGEATFEALFEAMEDAQRYILLEFYIVRSDRVGQRIKQVLKRKLQQGVELV